MYRNTFLDISIGFLSPKMLLLGPIYPRKINFMEISNFLPPLVLPNLVLLIEMAGNLEDFL
jgi:hypothetical protein